MIFFGLDGVLKIGGDGVLFLGDCEVPGDELLGDDCNGVDLFSGPKIEIVVYR